MALVYYAHAGNSIDYTPSTAVVAGDVVVQNGLLGVATSDIPADTLGALAVKGAFDFPVTSLTGWVVGDLAYWDATAKVATETATGNTLIGKVVTVDSRPGNPYVRVLMT